MYKLYFISKTPDVRNSYLLLFRTKLYQMCQCTGVQDFIKKVDYTFYQNLVDVLMPNVLRPIPSTLL